MLKSLLYVWLLFAGIYCVEENCRSKISLVVNTNTGKIKGITQRTFFCGTKYISFKGIPYAEPPIGGLRFQEPVPKKRWTGVLETNDTYGDACIAFQPLDVLPTKKSENCLFLNVYTPVKIGTCEKLPVMFYIHGGVWTEGEGSDQMYGPDHLMENGQRVIYVAINYRLGPFGFMNLDHPDCSGNMGLKDQQLALKWVHENIENFGGDKNCITIFGQSAGGSSVHYHLLSSESRKYFKRGICLSGSVFSYYASTSVRNHQSLVFETFAKELNNQNDTNAILKFLKQAKVEDFFKLPIADEYTIEHGPFARYFTPIVEYDQRETYQSGLTCDSSRPWKPFIAEDPMEIIKKTEFDKDFMFGFTTLEYLLLANLSDPYGWVDDLNRNFSIFIPVHYTEWARGTKEYEELQEDMRAFYFGNGPIKKNPQDLHKYIKMLSALNFDFSVYKALKLYSAHSKSRPFYYLFDLDLNLNYVRLQEHEEVRKLHLKGASHLEDVPYIFHQKLRQYLYDHIKNYPNDPKNRRTLKATKIVSSFFAEFAKTGKVKNFKPVAENQFNCIKLTKNAKLKQIVSPYQEAFRMWSKVDKDGQKLATPPFP